MIKEVTIGNRKLGPNNPLFISAEVGITCNYDMGLAKELINITAEAKADAVKFIFWFPDEIMSDKSTEYSYKTVFGQRSENMYKMLQSLRFSLDQWHELKEYADKKNIILFSTINSPGGITYALDIQLEAFKLSSWDFNYLSLWKKLATHNKPMIIDTGPAYDFELKQVIDIIREQQSCDPLLVHCFHTNNHKEMNMNSIPYMRDTYQCQVGFSSTDQRNEQDITAITLGAVYLEKRLTVSKNLPGHHHILSMEPLEFIEYVKDMRDVQKSLGTYTITPSQADLKERKRFFRSLVAATNLPAGVTLTPAMLLCKRPGNGVSPVDIEQYVGKKLKRSLKADEQLNKHDIV